MTCYRTGESPWVLEMIRKYHDIAKDNNAIASRPLLNQCDQVLTTDPRSFMEQRPRALLQTCLSGYLSV